MSKHMPPITTTARQLFDICLLRTAPQELPCSWEVLGLTLTAGLGLGYAAMWVYGPTPDALPTLLVGLLFTLGFIYGILAFRGLRIRFVQTASAIFGTDAIITLISLPVLSAAGTGNAQDAYLLFAMAGLGTWNLLVIGHILRHALSLPLPGGLLVALGYIFGSLFISQLIHG
ncbi:hypothetical protein [Nitrococcus mobilis]|uniref:Yip1 domain-containing protein n=1 Tax=Nitrococcus mobilis Nb-231 TaxID=314278 RepID=A4BSF5_9GAMM|nr:hypothetical protein [Nitrococcus mobilis]EAR21415.1 hypothetical protein NB231_13511 [Nitrococcus mobilis Nb-231]